MTTSDQCGDGDLLSRLHRDLVMSDREASDAIGDAMRVESSHLVDSLAAAVRSQACDICAYADAHGWWGPRHRGTHCRGCHRSWSGLAEAHCVTCHRHFGSNSTADRHHDHAWRCVDPATVRRKDGTAVFRRVERASGPVWVIDRRRPVHWWRSP